MEKDYLKINKALWNAKTEHHIKSAFYDQEAFMQGSDSLIGPEVKHLDQIQNKKILHLQCHFGQDSLSMARRGALVTGLDLSNTSIEKATALNAELGLNAQFVCADVYSARDVISERFDIVYTSYGTIGWLPDLDRWAKVISESLHAGGKLVFAEFHPAVWMFDTEFKELEYSYFNKQAIIETASGTYADRHADMDAQEVSWNHPLSDVFSSLLAHDMGILSFEEYDYLPYNCFHSMVQIAPHKFQIAGIEGKLPMMYVLVAQKLN